MRDPNRIEPFCDELARMWRLVPDWRVGQLMYNVLTEYQAKHGDFFVPEDDTMLRFFHTYFDQMKGVKRS